LFLLPIIRQLSIIGSDHYYDECSLIPLRRITQPELLDSLDRATFSPSELAGNLADIARLNRLTGTTARICHATLSLVPPGMKRITILDVGTGAGDVPILLKRSAIRRGLDVCIVAADWHPGVVQCLTRSITALRADALRLPIPYKGIDILICSQVLHHLTPEQITLALREFVRVTRCGFVLFDVERSRLAIPAARLLTWAISRNRFTRHDGPLSVRRAYRRGEMRDLAAQAGLNVPTLAIRTVFPFRWIGIYRYKDFEWLT